MIHNCRRSMPSLAQFWLSPVGGEAPKAIVSRYPPHPRAGSLVQVGIYVSQVVLIIAGQNTSSGVVQALHVFNGSLLLLVSILVAQKFGKTSMQQSST